MKAPDKSVASATAAKPLARHFSPWRLVAWVLLLLAAFGILQYTRHAWQVLAVMHGPPLAGAPHGAALGWMLAWDGLYLLGACLTLAVAAGALLGREWARRALRVVALLLALWALVSGVALMMQWQAFQRSSEALAALPHLDESGQALLQRLRRTFVLGIGMKLVAVPVLGWLAWRLGAPTVRVQFRRRR